MHEILRLFSFTKDTAQAVPESEEMLGKKPFCSTSELGALPAFDGLGARRMGDARVSYRPSSRMTLTDPTSLNSRTDCIFDITVRSWNHYWLDPLTFISVRSASCVALFTCSCENGISATKRQPNGARTKMHQRISAEDPEKQFLSRVTKGQAAIPSS